MIRHCQSARRATATAVLAGLVLLSACGDAETGQPVASAGDQDQARAPEDQDHPTPAPPVPDLEEDCDGPASVDAARATATRSAMATIDRIAATPLATVAEAAPTVIHGRIVGVEQGEVRPVDLGDHLAGIPDTEPQIQLMANILVEVDRADGPEATAVAAEDVVAVPFTVLAQAPADEAFAEHRRVAHANMVNELRCATPNVAVAVFTTGVGPAARSGGTRVVELPTLLWSTDPAAILLQTPGRGIASLDAMVPVGDAGYFAGTTSLDDLATNLD